MIVTAVESRVVVVSPAVIWKLSAWALVGTFGRTESVTKNRATTVFFCIPTSGPKRFWPEPDPETASFHSPRLFIRRVCLDIGLVPARLGLRGTACESRWLSSAEGSTCAVCFSGRGAGHETLSRSEEHTSELQSLAYLVCRLLLEKKKKKTKRNI